jgi:L-asparaginase
MNSGSTDGGPRLSVADLARVLPGLDRVATLQLVRFRQVPSVELTLREVLALEERLRHDVQQGTRGFVVTQGTDTLEECAFALDLVWDQDAPIVFTGAMRLADAAGADGPANLLAAIQVAASASAQRLGVVVVFNDEIHAAQNVRKQHTTSPAAFQSPSRGPIGSISEGRVHIWGRPPDRSTIPVPPGNARQKPVALVRLAIGDDDRAIRHVATQGYCGLVLEGLGGGHVPKALVAPLSELASRMPVVLSSRVGNGYVLRSTYGFPGSETELLEAGLIASGRLDGLKARVLLTMLLMAQTGIEEIRTAFAAFGV